MCHTEKYNTFTPDPSVFPKKHKRTRPINFDKDLSTPFGPTVCHVAHVLGSDDVPNELWLIKRAT